MGCNSSTNMVESPPPKTGQGVKAEGPSTAWAAGSKRTSTENGKVDKVQTLSAPIKSENPSSGRSSQSLTKPTASAESSSPLPDSSKTPIKPLALDLMPGVLQEKDTLNPVEPLSSQSSSAQRSSRHSSRKSVEVHPAHGTAGEGINGGRLQGSARGAQQHPEAERRPSLHLDVARAHPGGGGGGGENEEWNIIHSIRSVRREDGTRGRVRLRNPRDNDVDSPTASQSESTDVTPRHVVHTPAYDWAGPLGKAMDVLLTASNSATDAISVLTKVGVLNSEQQEASTPAGPTLSLIRNEVGGESVSRSPSARASVRGLNSCTSPELPRAGTLSPSAKHKTLRAPLSLRTEGEGVFDIDMPAGTADVVYQARAQSPVDKFITPRNKLLAATQAAAAPVAEIFPNVMAFNPKRQTFSPGGVPSPTSKASPKAGRSTLTSHAMAVHRKTALIVDHIKVTQRLAGVSLHRSGYATEGATTAEQAVQLIANQHFDLVLVDFQLQDSSAFEVAKAVRKWEQIRRAKSAERIQNISGIAASEGGVTSSNRFQLHSASRQQMNPSLSTPEETEEEAREGTGARRASDCSTTLSSSSAEAIESPATASSSAQVTSSQQVQVATAEALTTKVVATAVVGERRGSRELLSPLRLSHNRLTSDRNGSPSSSQDGSLASVLTLTSVSGGGDGRVLLVALSEGVTDADLAGCHQVGMDACIQKGCVISEALDAIERSRKNGTGFVWVNSKNQLSPWTPNASQIRSGATDTLAGVSSEIRQQPSSSRRKSLTCPVAADFHPKPNDTSATTDNAENAPQASSE